jgi:hypothetical protein
MRIQIWLWLIPAVITLHNLEEAIWLPACSQTSGRWFRPVTPEVFRFAAATLAIFAYFLAWMTIRSGRQSLWAYATLGYMVAVIINAVAPHLVLSIASRRYMPGVATGLFLNVPILSFLVWLIFKQDYVSGAKAGLACVVMPLLLLLSIPLLFRLGKVVASAC